MDDATAAAYAALAISIVAMFVAVAQALQQYYITGQLIRLCDSVVYGDLPGQGRRIWQMSQFRFRVVYKVPQIALTPDIWPASTATSFASMEMDLPDLIRVKPKSKSLEEKPRDRLGMEELGNPTETFLLNGRVGEASWASFCRTVYYSCHSSIGYTFIEGDADRCPDDIPTVPMQMSLRDCVVMAYMTAMECTTASYANGSITMQGDAGLITSSQHPVLGPMVHFTARKTIQPFGITSSGAISYDWLCRTMGNCVVSKKQYNWRRRKWVREQNLKFQKPERIKASQNDPGTKDNSRPNLSQGRMEQKREEADGVWRLMEDPLWANRSANIKRAKTLFEHPQPDFDDPIFSWELRSDLPKGPDHLDIQPTFTRMSLRHIAFETLEAYGEEYEIDRQDREYIIINRWVSEPEQDALWEHTKRLREDQQSVEGTPQVSQHLDVDNVSATGPPLPTWTRLSRRYLSLETLRAMDQDFEIDNDPEYIIIKRSLSEAETNTLWKHTQELRQARQSTTINKPHRQKKTRRANYSTEVPRRPKQGSKRTEDVDEEWETASGESEPDFTNPNDRPIPTSMDSPTATKGEMRQRVSFGKNLESSFSSAREDPRSGNSAKNMDGADEGIEGVDKFPAGPPAQTSLLVDQKGIGQIDWFWLSQTDIIPGFWATPWRSFTGLDPQTCIAAAAVLINGITKMLDGVNGIRYLRSTNSAHIATLSDTMAAMRDGMSTFPAYAYLANGGVICTGTYIAVSHVDFGQSIPVLDLIETSESYEVEPSARRSQSTCEYRLVELMRLDAWLSMVGRMSEIRNGRANLLIQTPVLIVEMMRDFQWRFFDADLWGGSSDRSEKYQRLAKGFIQALRDRNLSNPEILYVLVATLRTIKVGQAILEGADTRMVLEILEKDVQVQLV